jgi:hypothetical protein
MNLVDGAEVWLDAYEVADCKRVTVRLGSGIDAFAYVDARR